MRQLCSPYFGARGLFAIVLCPQRTNVCQYVGARGKLAVVALNVLIIDGILNPAENWRFGSLGGARTLRSGGSRSFGAKR